MSLMPVVMMCLKEAVADGVETHAVQSILYAADVRSYFSTLIAESLTLLCWRLPS